MVLPAPDKPVSHIVEPILVTLPWQLLHRVHSASPLCNIWLLTFTLLIRVTSLVTFTDTLPFSFDQLPQHLWQLTSQAESGWTANSASVWTASRGEGKWTRIELLGHLVDSAANNHQRFVRALAQPRLDWPGYDQVAHVAVQRYSEADPGSVSSLWAAYNRHISHVLRQVSPAQTQTPCRIGDAPEMTLSELASDYIAHLEHHLRQLLDDRQIVYSGLPWPPADKNRQWPV